jgi:hypothetical protein
MFPASKSLAALAALGLSLFVVHGAHADPKVSDPVNLLYDFQATGTLMGYDQATGKFTYAISAEGRAPRVKENGLIRPPETEDRDGYKVSLSGAQITFDAYDPANPPAVIQFTCAGCTLKFPDGSVLTSDEFVPLEGRALFLYGPVAPDPTKPIASIRMMGCAGLREINGTGRLANKVGSICFNGEFNFDVSDPNTLPATLTGQSNCTIVMHTPPAY